MKFIYPIIVIIFILFAETSCHRNNNADNSGTSRTIEVSKNDSLPLEVETVRISASDFSKEIACEGKISMPSYADVYIKQQAIIEWIGVTNGQKVMQGELIARLNKSTVEEQLHKIQLNYEKTLLEFKDILIGQGYDPKEIEAIPSSVVELARARSGLAINEMEIQQNKRLLSETDIVAPISGVVANVSQVIHNVADPSIPLCKILDDSKPQVNFNFMESEVGSVNTGDRVSISSPKGTFTGSITAINPIVEASGMIQAIAKIQNPRGLYEGMKVKVFVKKEIEGSIAIPKKAVTLRNERPVVFVFDSLRNEAKWQYVTLGDENTSEVIAESGIHPGDEVIVSDCEILTDSRPVKKITR